MRQVTKAILGTFSAVAVIAVAGAAQADKKSGTLNVAAVQQFEGLRPVFGTPAGTQLYNQVVYDTLINYDPAEKKFIPSLAESWKQVNPTTWEFKLRKSIKFHDGSDFDADDVVYTFNWVSNPKLKVRAKGRFSWIKEAKKIDSHTVQLISKRPFARTLGQLTVAPVIFPSDLHGNLFECDIGQGGGRNRGGGKAQGGGNRQASAKPAQNTRPAQGGAGRRNKGRPQGGGNRQAAAKADPKIAQARRAGKCKSDYGRNTPIGTGAYRVAAMERNKGLTLEALENYPHANSERPVPSIKRVKIQIIPEGQTQIAQMMVGAIDMAEIVDKELGEGLSRDARFSVTAVNALHYYWLNFDTEDRSGIGFLKDVRVRRAIAHAINYEELRKNVVVGGEKAFTVNAACVSLQANCSASVDLPKYDPGKAKQLLKEAGYPNGFAIQLTSRPTTRVVATAVSGYLSQVGIRAKVRNVPFQVMRRMTRQNKHNITVNTYGSSGIADAGQAVFFHWTRSPRNYSGDPAMLKFAKLSDTTLDPVKRAKIIRDAFDRNNRQIYVLPLFGAPRVFAHTKDLAVPKTSLNGYGAVLNQLKWK